MPASPASQPLTTAPEDHLSEAVLALLLELTRPSAVNDAEWLEKARNKLSANHAAVNDVLVSRTNSQLAALKAAYLARFGHTLLDALLSGLPKQGDDSYGALLRLVLTEDKLLS